MSNSALPAALVPPLDNPTRLLELIGQATGERSEKVRQRLDEEFESLGANVRHELEARQLPFHEWSDELVEFYGQTDAFVYETCIWNARPLKCEVRAWIGGFLNTLSRPRRILAFGDGLGFDSLYLAMAGHQVTYFEVSQRCAAFASQIFCDAQVNVEMLDSPTAIQPAGYDCIVCLDVLEHVPAPEDVVRQFANYLQPGGLLIASAPFYYTTRSVGTHLASNRRYSGDLRQLYEQHGFCLLDGRPFWDPIVLVNGSVENTQARGSVFKRSLLRSTGLLLRGGRFWNRPHGLIAEFMVRPPRGGKKHAI